MTGLAAFLGIVFVVVGIVLFSIQKTRELGAAILLLAACLLISTGFVLLHGA
jgi:hypothetical protein